MAILPATGNKAGQIEPRGEIRTEAYVVADNTTAFARGDLLCFKTGKWFRAGAADKEPFAMCIKDKLQAETRVELVDKQDTEVYMVADGVITPHSFVKAGPTGRVVSLVVGTDAENLKVGRYIKRAQYVPEGDGVTAAANSAQGDIVIVRLGAK